MSVQLTFLGGLGAIGRNCTVLEDQGRLAIIDVGLMFPEADMLGVDLVFPDWSEILHRADDVDCIILTHGHEDHVGGLGYLLADINVPVYGTEFTLELATGRIDELGIEPELHQTLPHQWYECGPFRFMHIPVVHSVPDATAIAFDTSEGIVLHSGDFKLDPTPIGSYITDLPTFAELGKRGVRLLLSDSTNAEQPGFVPSERSLADPIRDIVRDARGRVIAACFASHLHRIRQIAQAGLENNRRLAFLGFSMERITSVATEVGLLELPPDQLLGVNELLELPEDQQLLITTGSQGEPFAALSRMSAGKHRVVKVRTGDTILISAHPIPGNETAVSKVISRLIRQGAQVYHGRNANVHVSGHGYRKELQTFINVVRPQSFVPIHGEYRHLYAHAELARDMKVPWVEVLEDGDAVVLDGEDTWVERGVLDADYIYYDGSGLWDLDQETLTERRQLAWGGTITVSVVLDRDSKEIIEGPFLSSRGIADNSPESLERVHQAVVSVLSAIEQNGPNHKELKRSVAAAVAKSLNFEKNRRPAITPVIHYI